MDGMKAQAKGTGERHRRKAQAKGEKHPQMTQIYTDKRQKQRQNLWIARDGTGAVPYNLPAISREVDTTIGRGFGAFGLTRFMT